MFCRSSSPRLASSLLLILTSSAACANKPGPEQLPAQDEAKTHDAVTPAHVRTTTSDPLMRDLRAVVDNCRFNVQQAVISHCKHKEKNTLIREFREGERSGIEALPVLVQALRSEDPKLMTAAAKVIGTGLRGGFGETTNGAVPKELADELLTQYRKLPKRQAALITPVVVHTAMLSGTSSQLYQVLDTLEDVNARASAYNHIMTHGRMAAFPKVKDLLHDNPERVARAALQSASSMPNKTDAEAKQACELATSLLKERRLSLLALASSMAIHCRGSAFDAVQDELDARVADKTLAPGMVRATAGACADAPAKPALGSKAQCSRLRKQLETVVGSGLDEDTRAAALSSLGSQFADAATSRLASRHRADPSKAVRIEAARLVRPQN